MISHKSDEKLDFKEVSYSEIDKIYSVKVLKKEDNNIDFGRYWKVM